MIVHNLISSNFSKINILKKLKNFKYIFKKIRIEYVNSYTLNMENRFS